MSFDTKNNGVVHTDRRIGMAKELAEWVICTMDLKHLSVYEQAVNLFRYICTDLGMLDANNVPVLPECTQDNLRVFVHHVCRTWAETPYIWSILSSYTEVHRFQRIFEHDPGRLTGLVIWAYVLEMGVQYTEVLHPDRAKNFEERWLEQAKGTGGDLDLLPLYQPTSCHPVHGHIYINYGWCVATP